MKVSIQDGYLSFDLSEYPKEVSNYVIDQLEDRFFSNLPLEELFADFNVDLDAQEIEIPCLIQWIVDDCIAEKQYDMDWERRHGERDD